MKEEYTLIINLSLRSIRIIVFGKDEKKIYQDWLPIRTKLRGAFVEQDPTEWWTQLLFLFSKLFKTKEFSQKIKYISFTSSALCLCPLDKRGSPLTNAIMVSDKRAVKQAEFLKSSPLGETLTANPSFVISASYMMPKVIWLKEERPDIFKKTYKFLSSNDFLLYKLTGKFITDYLNAEKFYFETKNNRYPSNLLKFLNLKQTNFPKVVGVGTKIGPLRKSLVNKFKLEKAPEVIVGTYDAICAFLGSGVSREGELSNVCGTCSSYRTFSKNSFGLNNNGILSQYLREESLFIVGGSNNLEGGLLEWAKQSFYGDSFQKDDKFLYELMEEEAKESVLGGNGLIFLPYLIGERVPFWDSYVRGIFFGVERFHQRRDFIRSIFESIGFQGKLMIKTLEEKGMKVKNIKMSGGLSEIEFMCQLRSDIMGKEVKVLEEAETTALGAFILVQIATGYIKSISQANKIVKVRKVFKPERKKLRLYQRIFNFYLKLYQSSQGLFKKRNELVKLLNQKEKVVENL